jgi:preprotein translocase subunit YajC
VHFLLLPLMTWLQPDPTAPAPTNGGPEAIPGCGPGTANIGLLVVMFLVFYFMLIRPQQKRQREHDAMLKSLKRGDKVRTSGGIRGEVMEIGEHDVTLQIADRVKINVLRSHITNREAGAGGAAGTAGGEGKKD